MPPLDLADVTAFIEANVNAFHKARIKKLGGLSLEKVLSRKNPYLFKAKDAKTPDDFVRAVLDAFLSSGEETMFGNFLEKVAIYVNQQVYAGRKSGIRGMDLEFDKDGTRYLVVIKSGPSWGNSSQVHHMALNFQSAIKTLRTSGADFPVVCVNGCCYGVDDDPYKAGGFYKYCGQRFWTFISGSDTLFEDLILPIGYESTEWNERINRLCGETYARLMAEVGGAQIVTEDGGLDWKRITRLASAIKKP